jgi:deoxyribodipyrimidine photo-lyase
MTTAIWWIRRDLRLADNEALAAAMERAGEVIPIFVLDDRLLSSGYAGEKRVAFMLAGLRALDGALRARGSALVVRRGDPVAELARLVEETGAEAIFAEEDVSPYARARDGRAAGELPLHLVGGVSVRPPGSVLKKDGDPYVVYTPFSRAWKALPTPTRDDLLAAPERIAMPEGIESVAIPDEPALSPDVPFVPGEEEAERRLAAFTEGDGPPVADYAGMRNRMDVAGTSRLSPYLRWGMISARRAVVAAVEALERAENGAAQKGAEVWLNELIWREFYIHILYHFPHVRGGSFRRDYDAIGWESDEAAFGAWCAGRTGFPVVDAAMRELMATGWMHNRARMVAASFLVKDLLIDWRWGERWFMQHLVDGDAASNNGGWQWTAGTGTDAAPYFRIFNPVTQGKKFDPAGVYVRRWVAELAGVPDTHIQEPWKMSAEEQRAAGCVVGRDYPVRVVERSAARERTLAAYGAARERPNVEGPDSR